MKQELRSLQAAIMTNPRYIRPAVRVRHEGKGEGESTPDRSHTRTRVREEMSLSPGVAPYLSLLSF